MAGDGKTPKPHDEVVLSVAAALARSQLSPDTLKFYDAQHLSDSLNVMAQALARLAPLYVRDAQGLRELTAGELLGAEILRGATRLVLRDGTTFARVTIRRADLHQAISILKASGVSRRLPFPAASAR